MLCDETKNTLPIFLYHMKGNYFSFFYTNRGWWAMPTFTWNLRLKWPTPFEKCRLRPISAYNVSTVRASEKSSIITNKKSTTRFPTSYSWNAYVRPTPNSRKGWLKNEFAVFVNKIQVQSNKVKVCYKVSLCENFQRQHCSSTIGLSNGIYM